MKTGKTFLFLLPTYIQTKKHQRKWPKKKKSKILSDPLVLVIPLLTSLCSLILQGCKIQRYNQKLQKQAVRGEGSQRKDNKKNKTKGNVVVMAVRNSMSKKASKTSVSRLVYSHQQTCSLQVMLCFMQCHNALGSAHISELVGRASSPPSNAVFHTSYGFCRTTSFYLTSYKNLPPQCLSRQSHRSHWTWARSRSERSSNEWPEIPTEIHRSFILSIHLAAELICSFLTVSPKEGKKIFACWCSEDTLSSYSLRAEVHCSHLLQDAAVSS